MLDKLVFPKFIIRKYLAHISKVVADSIQKDHIELKAIDSIRIFIIMI